MKQQEKMAFMAMIAELYYLDNKNQSEIARLTGISQTKASRLIKKAREIGMVQVTVNKHDPQNTALEKELLAKYKLHKAVVIRTWKKQQEIYHYKNIGYFAASILLDIILDNSIICLSTSRHISYVIDEIVQLPKVQLPKRKLSIVQTQGGLGLSLTSHDAVEMGVRLASAIKARFYQMQAPAVTASKQERDLFMNHAQIKSLFEMMDKADMAIVGIGTVEDSVFIANDSFKHHTAAELKAKGAVGEVCGRFFDINGNECDTKYKDCVIGMDLEQLKRTPEVVAVTSGVNRVSAISTLITTGYIKSIITDEETATALLKR